MCNGTSLDAGMRQTNVDKGGGTLPTHHLCVGLGACPPEERNKKIRSSQMQSGAITGYSNSSQLANTFWWE